jgi:hypothetical protein
MREEPDRREIILKQILVRFQRFSKTSHGVAKRRIAPLTRNLLKRSHVCFGSEMTQFQNYICFTTVVLFSLRHSAYRVKFCSIPQCELGSGGERAHRNAGRCSMPWPHAEAVEAVFCTIDPEAMGPTGTKCRQIHL